MTTKEKANELVERYKPLVTTWDCYHDTEMPEEQILKDAKQCALIAVEEILNGIFSLIGHRTSLWTENEKETIEYWQSVKAEIEKL